MKEDELDRRRVICFQLITEKIPLMRTNRWIDECMTKAFDWDLNRLKGYIRK